MELESESKPAESETEPQTANVSTPESEQQDGPVATESEAEPKPAESETEPQTADMSTPESEQQAEIVATVGVPEKPVSDEHDLDCTKSPKYPTTISFEDTLKARVDKWDVINGDPAARTFTSRSCTWKWDGGNRVLSCHIKDNAVLGDEDKRLFFEAIDCHDILVKVKHLFDKRSHKGLVLSKLLLKIPSPQCCIKVVHYVYKDDGYTEKCAELFMELRDYNSYLTQRRKLLGPGASPSVSMTVSVWGMEPGRNALTKKEEMEICSFDILYAYDIPLTELFPDEAKKYWDSCKLQELFELCLSPPVSFLGKNDPWLFSFLHFFLTSLLLGLY